MNTRKWIQSCTAAAVMAALTFTLSPVRGQDRDDRGDRDHSDHDHGDRDHHDDRGRGHDRFYDHDRDASRDWYRAHHDHLPVGFRDRDRLPPGLEGRLRVGVVLDRDLRGRIHPVPGDLLGAYPPPPPRCRYVVIGGHIVLIDAGYHVADVIHFELNF